MTFPLKRKHLGAAERSAAFTLAELLTVIAIIALLASLSFAGYTRVQQTSDRAASISNLKQIASAINMYAADHDNRLPGPAFPGQPPSYLAAKKERLAVKLAKYLGVPEQGNTGVPADDTVVDVFVPPGFKRSELVTKRKVPLVGDDAVVARSLVLNTKVNAAGNEVINPWGVATEGSETEPMSLVELQGLDDEDSQSSILSSTWAISDADQEHPYVRTAPWKDKTSKEPYNGDRRTVLFFDWHAEAVDEDFFDNAP